MLVGRAGMSPVMVGRAQELDRVARLVVEHPGDRPAVALVGGEAGVGKTRLVRELLARMPAGLPVLAGQADPGALGRPFELLLDALDGRGDAVALAVVADRTRPLDERVGAGLELVREVICREQRGLVVLEDLHWADSESLLLLERLAEPDVGPVVLVGTYRPESVHRRHPLGEALPRLERRHSVTHIRLSRLTTGDVAEFLTAVYHRVPSFRVVEALHARTSGNPFFLEELLAAAGAEGGDGDPDRLVDQPLPWSLAEAVRSQVDSLEADERRIVETAAVLGRRVSFDVLATVTRTGEEELIDILRRIVARGLLVEDEHDLFSFRHALAREAIEQELLGRERRRLHQLALDALKESGSKDHASIAHHALGAGRDDEVIAAARAGAKQYLDQGSTYQALQLAELGLRVAEDDLSLLKVAARAAWLAGLVDDALGHNTHRLDLVRHGSGDDEALSATMRLQVRLTWEAGDEASMEQATAELAGLIDRLPPIRERGIAMAMIAQSHMMRDQVDLACEWADRALADADALDDDVVRAAAMVEKGSTLVMVPDRADEGSALLTEAAELGERTGEDVIVARALFNLVGMDIRPRDLEGTWTLLERMRAAAERVGFDSLSGAGYAQALADLAEWRGDYEDAVFALNEGRRLDRGYLRTAKGSWYANYEAGLALEAGDVLRAKALCDSMEPVPGTTRARWHAGLAMHVSSRMGDLDGARAALRTLVDDQRSTASAMYQVQMVHDVVSAALTAGLLPSELRPLVERIREAVLPDQQQVVEQHPGRRLVDAQLAEFEGRHDEALAGYAAAAPAVEQLFPYVRATAYVGAARCLIALGREAEAKDHVAEAEALLARWKGWRVDELDVVRRRLGIGDGPPGPAALTPREREVVALLAEGLTNAELAARLYISPKTAAVHVSNVLAKLGMASRTEVATWAIREGLAG